MFPLTGSKSVVVMQNGDSVTASYVSEDKVTTPCEIESLPYRTIEKSAYRIVKSPDESFALLVKHRGYSNKLPNAATVRSWAESVLAECLLFSVELASGTAECANDEHRGRNVVMAITNSNAKDMAAWITRFDLHETLDDDTIAKLGLLQNLETLVVGRQEVTSDGMKKLLGRHVEASQHRAGDCQFGCIGQSGRCKPARGLVCK